MSFIFTLDLSDCSASHKSLNGYTCIAKFGSKKKKKDKKKTNHQQQIDHPGLSD